MFLRTPMTTTMLWHGVRATIPFVPRRISAAAVLAGLLVSATATASAQTQTLPTIIYVDDDAAGLNNGSSWDNAYPDLQDALAEADSFPPPLQRVKIKVAQGSYSPGGLPTATFALIDGVTLEGGYAGLGACDPDRRNIDAFETILTGQNNNYHVVTADGNNSRAVLDGFTITGGNATGSISLLRDRGAGLLCRCASPRLVRCTFRNNTAVHGGGMFNLLDCSGPTFPAPGGPSLFDCRFFGNSADSGFGGAIESGSESDVRSAQISLTRCTISGNTAVKGGGIRCSRTRAALTNCVFSGNTSLTLDGDGGAVSCVVDSRIEFLNCTFSANAADGERGRALACGQGGPDHSDVTLTNCILWDGGNEVWNREPAVWTATYTNFQGGWADVGNIDLSPQFVDADGFDQTPGTADDDLRLRAGSACIDAGDNDAWPPPFPGEPESDLHGHRRFVDDPFTVDTGTIADRDAVIDMGATEHQPDCNANGVPDDIDIRNHDNQVSFESPGAWSSFNPGDHERANPAGSYSGAVFDGQYVYFVPVGVPSDPPDLADPSGEVLRYNAERDFDDPDAWDSYTPPGPPSAYLGAVFDGQYVYFVPGFDGNGYHVNVLRYNTRRTFLHPEPFLHPDSWERVNPEDDLGVGLDLGGYSGAVFDGHRYIYFAPEWAGNAPWTGVHGVVLRYDTRFRRFDDARSWRAWDPGDHGLGNNPDVYSGVVFDGRYVYFVPELRSLTSAAKVLRFDTEGAFEAVSSWADFAPGDDGPVSVSSDGGYWSAVFAEPYVYFLGGPDYKAPEIVRYDTRGDPGFDDSAKWTAFDYTNVAFSSDGYFRAVFDGRFVYFVSTPVVPGAVEVLRYDSRGSFTDDGSWLSFSPGSEAPLYISNGYAGAVFDGEFLYFAPLSVPFGLCADVLRYYTRADAFGDCDADGILDACESDLAPSITEQPRGVADLCEGDDASFTIGATGAPPLSYQWYRGGLALVNGPGVAGADSPSLTLSNVAAGTVQIYCEVSDACGAFRESDDVTLAVEEGPMPTIVATPDTTVCEGTMVTLDAGTGFHGYLWTLPDGSQAPEQTLDARESGEYRVDVRDANGCEGTDRVVVSVNPAPAVSITADPGTEVEDGTVVTLDAGDFGDGAAYLWSPGDTTTRMIEVTESGTFGVTVTAANGCQASAEITVTVRQQEFTLTIEVSGEGSVNVPSGTYPAGGMFMLVAAPAEGWQFVQWAGDAAGNDPFTSVTLDRDLAIVAVFEEIPGPPEPNPGNGDTDDGGCGFGFLPFGMLTLMAVPLLRRRYRRARRCRGSQ